MSETETYLEPLSVFGDNDGFVQIRSPNGTKIITVTRLAEIFAESYRIGGGTKAECGKVFDCLIEQEVAGYNYNIFYFCSLLRGVVRSILNGWMRNRKSLARSLSIWASWRGGRMPSYGEASRLVFGRRKESPRASESGRSVRRLNKKRTASLSVRTRGAAKHIYYYARQE